MLRRGRRTDKLHEPKLFSGPATPRDVLWVALRALWFRIVEGVTIFAKHYKAVLVLLALTAGGLLVHGYHPYSEDAEIYLPGVLKILHPELFPAGQEFFGSHANLTLFPNLIAFSLWVLHLPFETGLFLWHVVSIFFFLLACWGVSGLFSSGARARSAGVAL